MEFAPRSGLCALSDQEILFGALSGNDPIEFTDGDWAAYDDINDETVGIYAFESSFVTTPSNFRNNEIFYATSYH